MTEETPESLVLCERRDAIAILTLNRPHVRNAMSTPLRIRFRQLVAELRDDPSIRVIIITGAGDKAFSTGADLKERDRLTEEGFISQRALSCAKAMIRYPKPVIAALNGDTIAGGFELAIACDFRIAAEEARFGLLEVKRGIFPGSGATALLPRLIGVARAKELILTGRLISAQQALEMGLVGQLLPRSEVMDAAMSLAEELAAGPPLAIQQAKMVIELSDGMPLEASLQLANEAWNRCLHSEDRKEGIRAFVEKRPPNFTGR